MQFQQLSRQHSLYREAMVAGGGEAAETVQKNMEIMMQRYLSMKAALLAPSNMSLMMGFSANTASWLVRMALLPSKRTELAFPLPEEVSPMLKYIPEAFMENIIEHLLLAKRLLELKQTLACRRWLACLTPLLQFQVPTDAF